MSTSNPGNRALRKGRFSEQGAVYVITTVTHDRRPLFQDFLIARMGIEALRHQERVSSTRTWAYVLMPDHLHWMVQLRDGSSISAVVRRAKRFSAVLINRHRMVQGRVWQPGFHDRRIRDDAELYEQHRYIVENPVRAGIVTDLQDYPHWDAGWVEGREVLSP